MALIALGLNHLTAPLDLREKVAFAPEITPLALSDLARQPGVNEALILSTCNRTELYVDVDAGAEAVPQHWLSAHHHLTERHIDEFLYRHTEDAAVRHLFRVATGLDSMVLGEPQILAQVKQAYQLAQERQSTGPLTHEMFQAALRVAKRVAAETSLYRKRVSIASVAVGE